MLRLSTDCEPERQRRGSGWAQTVDRTHAVGVAAKRLTPDRVKLIPADWRLPHVS